MSHLSAIFNKVPVKVQKRSGFDLSHENLFTAKVGTLIPASVEEVLPGDVISIGGACAVELPPLATNFKGRVDAKLEAFFVPDRLLWGGWQSFITQDINSVDASNTGNTGGSGVTVPSWNTPTSVPNIKLDYTKAGAGSLADYLGMKNADSGVVSNAMYVNALPFAAYWRVWDDWYRDSNIQQPFFYNDGAHVIAANGIYAAGLPYERNGGTLSNYTAGPASTTSCQGVNGKSITELAQRNFAKDYFTSMTYQPQAGAGATLQFSVDTATTTAGFSIAQLRAANSLQRWLERNNIAGTRYFDQILAHYGVLPSDAVFQRPVLLGSMTTPVIINSIAKTTGNGEASAVGSTGPNPYSDTTGAQFGRGTSFGKDRLVDNFQAKEHGYVIIMFSLVPHAYYGTGSRKYMFRSKSADYAFPEFANIGDEAITRKQLCTSFGHLNNNDVEVGYVQRYADYKYHDDEVHGLLADGQSLAPFVLQRGFDTGVTLSSSMLEIPTDYMDGVMAVSSFASGFNAIVDCYFDSKFLRVLPEYSLPSLCESEGEGGKKVYVPKGGTRL